MNLFLSESGVVKLGCFGLSAQLDCFSKKKWHCEGLQSFSYDALYDYYDEKSDVWSFGSSLLEMIGIVPYYNWHGMDITVAFNDNLSPFSESDIALPEFLDFLNKCFVKDYAKRWCVNQLMEVNECREGDK